MCKMCNYGLEIGGGGGGGAEMEVRETSRQTGRQRQGRKTAKGRQE